MSHLSALSHSELIARCLELEKQVADLDSRRRTLLAAVGETGKEVLALRDQVTSLQEAATNKTNASLYRVVRAFHVKFGHPVAHSPIVPDDEQMRFRAKLIGEEFLELLDGVFNWRGSMMRERLHSALRDALREAPVEVNLEELYDAMIDLAWVIEGTHAVCGTMAEPGIAEVARANTAKDPVYVAHKDAYLGGGEPTERDARLFGTPDPKAKPKKPAGWTPPDIRGVLVKLGWKP